MFKAEKNMVSETLNLTFSREWPGILGYFGALRRVFCCIDSKLSEKFTGNMFRMKSL
jgi:hypothetical protein